MTHVPFAFHPDVEDDLDAFLSRPDPIRRRLGELYQRVCNLSPREMSEGLLNDVEVVGEARLFSLTHEGDGYSIVAYIAEHSAGVVALLFAYVDSPESLAQAQTLARARLLNL
jgi:hypothetical protein